ncbi:MAG: hypothetical protein J7M24_06875 [Candidatus Latescibacteria bacterium]|nr:hypothetical protein [Candidatus Latescibacterota bacterium]
MPGKTLVATLIACALLAAVLTAGCAKAPFFRPPGDKIASCTGKLRQESGGTVRFTISVYRSGDSEIALYASIPRNGIRYATVEDISFDDGVVTIVFENPEKTVTGAIAGDSLKFEGKWDGVEAAFTFRIDD